MATINRITADLALVLALPDHLPDPEDKKLKYLFGKLSDRVIKRFRKYPKLNHAQMDIVQQRLLSFGEETKWEGKEKSIGTYLSFILCVMDAYQDTDSIIKIINQICAYFEDSGQWSPACNRAGALAFERWEEVWK